jgi:hypothetical protein
MLLSASVLSRDIFIIPIIFTHASRHHAQREYLFTRKSGVNEKYLERRTHKKMGVRAGNKYSSPKLRHELFWQITNVVLISLKYGNRIDPKLGCFSQAANSKPIQYPATNMGRSFSSDVRAEA